MDGDRESTVRRNPLDNVLFKLLVPSVAAGAIIGKGGEAIAQVQKEFGAKVKMSKANDFYPGTTERVCLIQGSVEAITGVVNYVMEKVLEKPDPNPKLTGDGKLNVERHKQVKILVPNSTAGMIIGKKGAFIKEIMDDSGAYVQISQKPKDQTLSERCVTVAGDAEANREAVGLILSKIAEDPQSASCPNISYADISGPVASAYPTGSPFAANAGGGGAGGGGGHQQQLNSSQGSGSFAQISADTLRASLRASGYSDTAADEIVGAMATLANYGFFNLQSLVTSSAAALISGPTTPLPLVASPHSSFNLPAGSMSALPLPDAQAPNEFAGAQLTADQPAFIFPSGHVDSYQPSYPGAEAAAAGDKAPSAQAAAATVFKRELDVPESLIGVIIGPGGKDIVELQNSTRTSIQVSKRSDMQAHSRHRVVTITGLQVNVLKAERIIQQRLNQEDQRRQNPN